MGYLISVVENGRIDLVTVTGKIDWTNPITFNRYGVEEHRYVVSHFDSRASLRDFEGRNVYAIASLED